MENPNFYSQNFEDVLLARCFADLQCGFYIDVGAQHEEIDSVTRFFYERGWSGVNIEPVAEFAQTFECRERDITICCAAGSEEKALNMSVSLETGLSSFKADNAEQVKISGHSLEARLIQVRKLNSILEAIGIAEKNFEFLKIDVEGFELDVIKGINLSRYRPRVILCEVTNPNTSTKADDFPEICFAVESYNYIKVYFDGLNQWWCAAEFNHEIMPHFKHPPGPLDSALISPYQGFTARRQVLELTQMVNSTTHKLNDATQKVNDLNQELSNVYSSFGWKLLQKLRKLSMKLRPWR